MFCYSKPFAVILSPSLVILRDGKNLSSSHRANSAENLALGAQAKLREDYCYRSICRIWGFPK